MKPSPSHLIPALLLAGLSMMFAAPAGEFKTDPGQKALRKEAAGRPRRILYNNDGNEPMHMDAYSIDEFLALRTSRLAGAQVDTILYCTYCSGFGLFTHKTKVGTVMLNTKGRHSRNKMADFLKHDTDPLAEMIKFSRQHGKEIFWSLRMNDTHDGSNNSYGPILFKANPFKTAHPEWLLGSTKNHPHHGKWSGLNYAVPEVREFVFRVIEEVCQNYDVDGVEFDFFRHPTFFKYPAPGQGVSDEERGQMTGLMRRVRLMMDAEGKKRGRPILAAMKVPDSLGYCNAIGIDLERWLADDLLDILVTSSYIRLNEWSYSVELGHKHGVKVYPSLDESRVVDKEGLAMRMTANGYRGRAAEVLAQGADGVYLYNFFGKRRPYEILDQIGGAEQLAREDKDYFASVLGKARVAGGAFPHDAFHKIETLSPGDPKEIQPGGKARARVYVADDPTVKPPPSLKLRLRFAGAAPSVASVSVDLNGARLDLPQANGEWIDVVPPVSTLRQGANIITVRVSRAGKKPVKWTDAVLQVRANRPS